MNDFVRTNNYVAISRKVPSVIKIEAVQIAKARAAWIARTYGVSAVVKVPADVNFLVELELDAIGNDLDFTEVGDGAWSAESADAYYSLPVCDSHDAIHCSLCGTYM